MKGVAPLGRACRQAACLTCRFTACRYIPDIRYRLQDSGSSILDGLNLDFGLRN